VRGGMDVIRLALIGCGRWGRNYIKAAEDAGNATIAAIVLRRSIIGDSPHVPVVSWLDELPAGIDAVVYAGHPSGAVKACETALAMGLPIMVEKPVGLSLAAAEQVKVAEGASKAFVLVNHQHLFAEGYRRFQLSVNKGVAWASMFGGPASRDYSPIWDYGPHAVSTLLGIGIKDPAGWTVAPGPNRIAKVSAKGNDGEYYDYDGYAPQEPPLTRSVRAFAAAVAAGGTDDYRFGAHWAVNVNRILEAANRQLKE